MAGLTPEGLVIQRLSDILASQRVKAVELFQDLVPIGDTVDTSENTAIGRLIALAAPSNADLWEALGQVDSAFDPERATDIALDKLVKLGGLTRFGESQATLKAMFTGDSGVVIPFNSAARATVTNAIWRTRTNIGLDFAVASGVIIDITTITNSAAYSITYTTPTGTSTLTYTSDASATKAEILAGLTAALSSPHAGVITTYADSTGLLHVDKVNPYLVSAFTVTANLTRLKAKMYGEMIAEVPGEIDQPVDTVTSIATPILNWDSVNNFTASEGGASKETDDELRIRFRDSKYERASNILESLYSALKAVEGVEEVIIYENDTDTTDGNGVPPHSFMPVVSGTADLVELANTVWDNKPLGIKSHSVSPAPTSIIDSQGFTHLVGVQIPTDKIVYISMNLTKDSSYPANGDALMKEALIAYFDTQFGIGDDVIYSRLYTPINQIPGHQVNTLTIGFTASPVGVTNLTIGATELAALLSGNIIIT